MKRVLRWIGFGLGGLASLALLAAAAIFLMSEQSMAGASQPIAKSLPRPTPAMVADAPRQARILGCVSCHGERLEGKLMVDIPNVARVYAPNLTQVAARATDRQLEAAIRQGIGHDGRSLFVMPSVQYSRLDDREVAALIGWIRTFPRVPGSAQGVEIGPLGRVGIVTGKFRPMPAKMEEYRTQVPIHLGSAQAAGRDLAAKVCSECHGPALYGTTMENGLVTPDLTLVGAYDPTEFRTLMRTGKGTGGRDLGLMTKIAKLDLSHLSEEEVKALHGYLKARAERLGN